MKRFLILLLLGMPFFAFTDTRSWVYLHQEAVTDSAPYTEALVKSDLDKYRYFDQRNTLHFENGLDAPGCYDVILVANNATNCPGTDTFKFVLT